MFVVWVQIGILHEFKFHTGKQSPLFLQTLSIFILLHLTSSASRGCGLTKNINMDDNKLLYNRAIWLFFW